MRGTYPLYRLAQALSNWLPRDACAALAQRLADLHWRRSHSDRAAVESNLASVLNSTEADGSQMAREVFRNFARYLVEFLAAHRLPQLGIRVEGTQEVVNRIGPGQGCILLSAHIGNWELAAIMLRRLGFPVSVVALTHQDPRVNEFFDNQRLRCGVGVVPLGAHAAARCIQLLEKGQLLGILGDREFGPNGVSASFFGRQAVVPRGPAILSLWTGVPVIPVFLIREGLWRFRFYIEQPIWPPKGPRTKNMVQQLTQAYVKVMEGYIRRFPNQWLMFQQIHRALNNTSKKPSDS